MLLECCVLVHGQLASSVPVWTNPLCGTGQEGEDFGGFKRVTPGLTKNHVEMYCIFRSSVIYNY